MRFGLLLIVIAFTLNSCLKDRAPDPSTLNFQQSTIYIENFNETSIPLLPLDWSASPVTGWQSDSSNSSTGYSNASGLNNIVVNNDTVNSIVATLNSKSISTSGYDQISIMYGARRSKHFSDNGSVVNLSYSVDGGTTWRTLTYSEVINDSNWYLVNGTVRIFLPSDASNKSSLIIRWTAILRPTSGGTYRIDDFGVFGTSF